MQETVLTSRRATLVVDGRSTAGRLRLSDRTLRFTPDDGTACTEVPLAAVRRVALRPGRRAALLVDASYCSLRLQCFGARGVAGLLLRARAGTGIARSHG